MSLKSDQAVTTTTTSSLANDSISSDLGLPITEASASSSNEVVPTSLSKLIQSEIESYLYNKGIDLGNLKTVGQQLTTLQSDFGTFVKNTTDDVKETKTIAKNLSQNLDEAKERITQTLGIFVSMFTFVSVNFQLFSQKKMEFGLAFGLILVLGAILIIFNLLLYLTMKEKKEQLMHQLLFFAVALLVFGLVIFFTSKTSVKPWYLLPHILYQ